MMIRLTEKLKIRFNFKLLLIGLLCAFAIFLATGLSYFGKVAPRTFIGKMSLGGKAAQEAGKMIAEKGDAWERSTINFEVNGKIIPIEAKTLGIKYDSEATLNLLFDKKKTKNWLSEKKLKPVYRIDFDKLANTLHRELSAYETPAANATINAEVTPVAVSGEKEGTVVDNGQLVDNLKRRIDNFSLETIPVRLVKDEPQITANQLQKAAQKLDKLKNQSIILTYNWDKWNLDGGDIVGITSLGKNEGVNLNLPSGVVITRLALADTTPVDAEIGLDEEKITSLLNGISKAIDRPTVDATLQFEDGKIKAFTPAIDGQRLNREAARNLLLSKFSINDVSNDKTITLKLPVEVTTAKVANEKINSLGIRELVGRGISYFSGSIANRIYNVQLGASRVNGALIAPGEVFSFNSSVGEVSGNTGYKQAYVISEGRTVLDDGGGICQVSTTVFRAALDAGLPIVSRTGHAYRVGYYEQHGFGPGLDATVWAPSVDFIFKNDTAHHILVQTIFDPYNERLEVDLYGTKDGREVEIGKSVVSNEVPPLPEKRQDDPSLPKGTVKQVDFPAWGANVYFTRKVVKGGQTIANDTFRTNYRAWQAVYLVGTGG